MAIQNNGITFNVSDNANVTLTQSPHRGNYTFGKVQPHSQLDAEDAVNAHLAGVNAMLSSIISDPEYEGDEHLLQILFAVQLNVGIAMDSFTAVKLPAVA